MIALYQNIELTFCVVCVISANKLSLQELTQLIGIKLLILRFLENFAFYFQFPGSQMPVSPPCGRPCVSKNGKFISV